MSEAYLDNNNHERKRPHFRNLLGLVGIAAVGLVDAGWLIGHLSHLDIFQVAEDSVFDLGEMALGGVVGYIGGLMIDHKLEAPKN